MTNTTIVEYLNHYIESDDAKFAVQIKGQWGAGKTFFIKKMIDSWSKEPELKDYFVFINPIYISLNGLNSQKQVIQIIKEKISPYLYSKGVEITKNIIKSFAKSTLKLDFNFDDDPRPDGSFNLGFDPIAIFKGENDKITGNRIIIFDDIERCKIPIDEIYGFINDFVEHSNCKIILISDEEKIKDTEVKKAPAPMYDYSSIREKIIGQTFEILPDVMEAVDYFIESGTYEIKRHLTDNKQLIIRIFNAAQKKNLRVLERALFDFDRLFKNIDKTLQRNADKYPILFKNYFAYFLIYYMEFNTGNVNIISFQSLFNRNDQHNNYQNYEEVIKIEKLHHSTRLFSSANLMNFISNGNYSELIYEINNSLIYKPNEEKKWEKLWYWRYLDDEEFSALLEKVQDCFFNSEDLHFTEVLHISGILFQLKDYGLYTKKSKLQISLRARQHFSKSNDLEKVLGSSQMLRTSARKDYLSASTAEFKALIDNLKSKAGRKVRAQAKQYIEDTLFNISNGTVDQLYESFNKYNEGLNSKYENTPIFQKVNTKTFASVVLTLNNTSISDLNDYFIYRYYPEKRFANVNLEPFHKKDLAFITALKIELESECQKISNLPLKFLMLDHFIKNLEEIINRLSQL